MPDKTTLPQQITETSLAFAQTLELENRAFQGQLNGAIAMTLNAVAELFALCREAKSAGNTDVATGQKNLSDTAQKAVSDVQNAAGDVNKTPVPAMPEAEATLDAAVVHAVAMSYQNAVNAQQQMYISQQAAATQTIVTILNIATAVLSEAVKETV